MNLRAYFARHAQTLVGSLGRMAQQPFATVMTMAVVAVALALPLFFGLFLQNALNASGNLRQAFDVSVYMSKSAGSARAQALAKELRLRNDVATVRVIGADDALAEFRDTSGFGTALDALTDNPLPDTLVVTPTAPGSTAAGVERLKQAIVAMPEVQTVQLDTQWVQKLIAFLALLRRIVLLTAALLGLGIVLVVSNTIRLDILNRRAEIEVMKLVGASNAFTRRPFLYSGVWYGLGGSLLALSLVGGAGALLAKPVERLALAYGSSVRWTGLGVVAAAQVLGVSIVLAWIGSWLSATRHIRAIEPT